MSDSQNTTEALCDLPGCGRTTACNRPECPIESAPISVTEFPQTTDLQIENFDTTPPEVLRLDALIKAVCLMHNALEWADRRYSGVYGEQIKEALLPLLDDLKTRGKL